jgi:molybdate transport system substrate-binding protein
MTPFDALRAPCCDATGTAERAGLSWRALALCLYLLALPHPRAALAAELHVAVAANFLSTLQQLSSRYEQRVGDRIVASAGSSGQLYSQIRQGAPFDLFLSADSERPRRLEEEHLIVPGSRFTYAIGTLVLWSARPGFIDRDGQRLRGGDYRYLAIGDPSNAPYGAAARILLMRMGLWQRLGREQQLVVGESLTQTYQFIASGSADLGFVALSQVIGRNGKIAGGSYWIPPQSMYPPIQQDAVVLARSAVPQAAQAFDRWLRADPAAAAIIRAAGYRTAD